MLSLASAREVKEKRLLLVVGLWEERGEEEEEWGSSEDERADKEERVGNIMGEKSDCKDCESAFEAASAA